jgi:hypothetical protein
MSIWYDDSKKKYRSSLIHKIFYNYGWKPIRFFMFLLPSEFVHHQAIKSIWLIHKLDAFYNFLKLIIIIPLLLILLLLAKLPFFHLTPPSDNGEPQNPS